MEYPVYVIRPNGRVTVGVDSEGKPADCYERVTGWVNIRPTDHRKRRRLDQKHGPRR